jgi:hypothetical protein
MWDKEGALLRYFLRNELQPLAEQKAGAGRRVLLLTRGSSGRIHCLRVQQLLY